jgi:hypothetical protein
LKIEFVNIYFILRNAHLDSIFDHHLSGLCIDSGAEKFAWEVLDVLHIVIDSSVCNIINDSDG